MPCTKSTAPISSRPTISHGRLKNARGARIANLLAAGKPTCSPALRRYNTILAFGDSATHDLLFLTLGGGTMQSRDFCFWLQGFFELSGDDRDIISDEQA